MTATTLHDSIQNAVIAFVTAYNFPLVTYDPTTKLRSTGVTTQPAKTALCHRVTGNFGDDSYGTAAVRGVCLARGRSVMKAERWRLELGFDNDVDLSGFESALSAAALSALVDPSDSDGPKVFIDLAEVEQSDPAEQQGSTGLRALYNLRVSWPGAK